MKLGIIGNLEKEGLREAVHRFIVRLQRHHVEYVLEDGLASLLLKQPSAGGSHPCGSVEECASKSDMVVAFGGDGTILAAARMVGKRGTPILGINLGKLGFLAEVAPDEIEQAADDLVAKKYLIEERLVLRASSPALQGRILYAVNDIVVDKSRSSRVIDLGAYIDNVFAATFRADGVIVCTPTGSTAYSLSSGGPIVIPTSKVIGITPVSPHTLSGRPLVIPEQSQIRLVVSEATDEVLISADGQIAGFFKTPVEISIQKAEYTVRLVKKTDKSYFDVLRAKLLWGKDARSAG